jgi:hypothetical protein
MTVVAYQSRGGVGAEPVPVIGAGDLSQFSIHDVDLKPGTDLSIVSPYNVGTAASNSLTHPAIILPSRGVDGSRYLMAVTPFAGADDTTENPCIYVSDDLRSWRTPNGVSNPIFPQPAAGYNSDVHLYEHSDGWIYLIWRKRINTVGEDIGSNTIYASRSYDGIIWSTAVAILQAVDTDHDWASPSFWHDGSNWIFVSHNISGTNQVEAMTKSGDFIASWNAVSPSTLTVTHPNSLSWWHSDIRRLPNGRLIGLAFEGGPGGGVGQGPGGGSCAWLWQSDNSGATWSVRQITRGKVNYRSSLILDGGHAWIVMVWIDSETNGTPVSTTLKLHYLEPGRIERRRHQAVVLALSPPYSINIQDNQSLLTHVEGFAGAAADLSAPWTQVNGGSALRRNGSGYAAAASTAISAATVDTTVNDHSVQAKIIAYTAGTMYLIAKYIDANNYALVGLADGSGKLAVKAIVAGATVLDELMMTTPTLAVGSILRVDVDGLRLRAYIDGIVVPEVTLPSALAGGKRAGLYIFDSTSNNFDEFAARPL